MHTEPERLCVKCCSLLTLIISLITSSHLFALDVGDIKLESTQGYPLLVSMPLSNTEELIEEEIHIKQASIEIYEDLGVDRTALYKTLLFDIDENRNLNVYSKNPIEEPFLHFVIELRWPEGNLYREVKVLIDTPATIN